MDAVIQEPKPAAALEHVAAAHPQVRADRVLQLDILRGLAVLLVLFRHAPIKWARSRTCQYFADRMYNFGWTGVDLFFVLSGFLIGGLLFREIRTHGRLDAGRFLIRRGFKIWPSYFLLVAVAMAMEVHKGGWHHGWLMSWPNWCHLQNYFFPTGRNPMLRGQTWSLSVEEHFYLALPALLLLAPRRKRNGKVEAIPLVPWLAAGVFVLCLALRLRNWNRPYNDATHLFPTHLRMDGLLFGVLLAYAYHFYPALLAKIGSYRNTLLCFGLALVLPMVWLDLHRHALVSTIGLTMLYVGYGSIMVALIHTRPREGWLGWVIVSPVSRILAFMGVFSYAIYLWRYDLAQGPMERWLMPHFQHLHIWGPAYYALVIGTYIAWCTLAGLVVTKLVEVPALRVRDWLFPARARAMPLGAPGSLQQRAHANPVGIASPDASR